MKAIVYTKYGPPDVLHLKDVEKPVPKDNQVLIKIRAAALNAADWHLMRAKPFLARFFSGILAPKKTILGADIAGVVEAVGRDVTEFKPGDSVFGDLFESGLGGFAEYACALEHEIALKPSRITFDEAAAVPVSAGTALRGLRDCGHIKAGQKVLINGASGGVGTFAVQIAKTLGAEVTGVCSPGNMDMVRSLGADHVIDYTKEDFTKNGIGYDLILAANGYHPIADYKRALNSDGIYVMSGGTGAQMAEALLKGPWMSMTGKKKMMGLSSKPNKKDLLYIKEILEAGKVKSVIDKVYPLSETADAMRYLELGHAKGKVIITVSKG
jgi:NADPH:quinone reductase-like Zn-dependent oxidoreductase